LCTNSYEDTCKFVIDLAVSQVCVYPTEKVSSYDDFVGTKVLGQGYIYKGGAINYSKCKPFHKCFGNQLCIIGTFTFDATIINPEFNKALKYLTQDNKKGYLRESCRLSGRVLTDSQLRLSFSDSCDFYLPSEDTIVISGRVPWGIKGEDWKMAIMGGTGQYHKACGDVEVYRLIVANGSCSGFGESWRMCFNLDDISDC